LNKRIVIRAVAEELPIEDLTPISLDQLREVSGGTEAGVGLSPDDGGFTGGQSTQTRDEYQQINDTDKSVADF